MQALIILVRQLQLGVSFVCWICIKRATIKQKLFCNFEKSTIFASSKPNNLYWLAEMIKASKS
jgi:hypothetical protein